MGVSTGRGRPWRHGVFDGLYKGLVGTSQAKLAWVAKRFECSNVEKEYSYAWQGYKYNKHERERGGIYARAALFPSIVWAIRVSFMLLVSLKGRVQAIFQARRQAKRRQRR